MPRSPSSPWVATDRDRRRKGCSRADPQPTGSADTRAHAPPHWASWIATATPSGSRDLGYPRRGAPRPRRFPARDVAAMLRCRRSMPTATPRHTPAQHRTDVHADHLDLDARCPHVGQGLLVDQPDILERAAALWVLACECLSGAVEGIRRGSVRDEDGFPLADERAPLDVKGQTSSGPRFARAITPSAPAGLPRSGIHRPLRPGARARARAIPPPALAKQLCHHHRLELTSRVPSARRSEEGARTS